VRFKLTTLVSLTSCLLSVSVFVGFLAQSNVAQSKAQDIFSSEQIIIAVNEQRLKNNLPKLTKDTLLDKAASNKAKDMAEKGYFSHISPVDGKKWSDFIKESNYKYKTAGENLATGFDRIDLMVDAWMKSPSHRENILNPKFEETAISISNREEKGKKVVYVVQVFGKEA
jgi:uncharacterized protein YkwD